MIKVCEGTSAKATKWLAMFAVVALGACGEPDDKPPGGGGGTTAPNSTNPDSNPNPNSSSNSTTSVSAADCLARCEALGARCDVPEAEITMGCELTCSQSLTDGQLSCLEGKSCAELATDGQDCLQDEPTPNPNPNQNSGEQPVNNTYPGNDIGGACNCDPNPDYQLEEPRYGYCEGNTNGCRYELLSDDPQLGCLYDYKTGAGTCVYTCYEDQEGTQGSCPDDYACYNSGRRSITDAHYYTCE